MRPAVAPLLFASVVAVAALAPRGSRGDPPATAPSMKLPPSVPGNVEISADVLEVDTTAQAATMTGKVIFTKGTDLSLRCPKIEVKYESTGPRVSWARGSGGILAEVKGVRAEAPEFELDLVKQHLSLRGGVRLYRGQGWVAADGAEIDLSTARVTMTNVKASLPVGNALKKP
jgi:lipopolysaccharide export system protein LptA